MADRKLIEKIDAVLDLVLIGLGFSQFRRRIPQQPSGAAAPVTRVRPLVPPKIPEILEEIEDAEKRAEISRWFARFAPEGIDRLEQLKVETLRGLVDKSEAEREQIVKSLRLPLAGPQTVPQKARFVWAETKKKLQQIEREKLQKTTAAIHEAAEKRRLKEQEREAARQNPKTGAEWLREWITGGHNKNTEDE